MTFIFHSLILILAGILLLRISGRKSISQMTLAQTIVMISIGTIIVAPIVGKDMVKTISAAAIFVFTVIILEFLQLKSNAIEKFITGKSIIVIDNGVLNIKNLKKLRLTVDQLEMRIRNEGISRIEDIKIATIEPNGLLGYELKNDVKPLTIGEFSKMMESFGFKMNMNDNENSSTIFNEIKKKTQKNPNYLK
ncbi:DUF421 domain-containing protein [Gottfriedia luciferensis]|uniref:DUF421 domain-containing protein n=1 Tax=Gottfriedia luciferensis TaxID=178774 RepID=UPI000B435B84|nr:YetF domain-containing protein [Gottfriedia luciferensis]